MALIVCPECRKEISDTASSCPNCGYRLKKKGKKKINSGRLILILIIAIGMYVAAGKNTKSPQNNMESQGSSSNSAPNKSVYDTNAADMKSRSNITTHRETSKNAIDNKQSPQEVEVKGKPKKDFAECLMTQARYDKSGKLSSYDGGTSAMQLMVQCKATWYAYVEECMQETNKTEGDCNLQAGILAQSALKLLGK